MPAEPSVNRRTPVPPSMSRNLGLRRAALRRRWADETNNLLSDASNAPWIMDSIAELDLWGELRGAPPFTPGDSFESRWGDADRRGSDGRRHPSNEAAARNPSLEETDAN